MGTEESFGGAKRRRTFGSGYRSLASASKQANFERNGPLAFSLSWSFSFLSSLLCRSKRIVFCLEVLVVGWAAPKLAGVACLTGFGTMACPSLSVSLFILPCALLLRARSHTYIQRGEHILIRHGLHGAISLAAAAASCGVSLRQKKGTLWPVVCSQKGYGHMHTSKLHTEGFTVTVSNVSLLYHGSCCWGGGCWRGYLCWCGALSSHKTRLSLTPPLSRFFRWWLHTHSFVL